MMYHRGSDSWLMVRRKHTVQYTNILKARCKISDLPPYIMEYMTDEEISHLEALIAGTKDMAISPGVVPDIYLKTFVQAYGKAHKVVRNSWRFMYHALSLVESVISVRRSMDIPYPSLPYEWPKGHKEKDENSFTSAVREFMEETSITSIHPDTIVLPTIIEQKISTALSNIKTDYWIFISPLLILLSQPDPNDIEVSDRAWITTKECLSTLPHGKIETLTKALSIIEPAK